jgi:hypothetical protein
MSSGCPEQEVSGLFELHHDEPLAEGNSSARQGIREVTVEPKQELLPHLPLWLDLLGSL